MSWKNNAAMWWSTGTEWLKVTDHGRSALEESIERIENKSRMVNGSLRRYSVAKKRTWNISWTNLPSKNNPEGGMSTADGGMSGEELENWHDRVNFEFPMMLRKGSAINKPVPSVPEWPWENDDFYFVHVMITDFSKSVVKRGKFSDLWEVSITLEEV